MKAITLWQPQASAMMLGLKRIETRHWRTHYRGPLIIHAAGRPLSEFPWGRHSKISAAFHERGIWHPHQLPRGYLLCVVDLVDCIKISRRNRPKDLIELRLGDYTAGRYAWLTENLRPLLLPIQWKGSQRFFNVPDDVVLRQGCQVMKGV